MPTLLPEVQKVVAIREWECDGCGRKFGAYSEARRHEWDECEWPRGKREKS